jgi:hypothetical protein
MKNVKKLISIFMLIVALCLSITVIFGWYTINDDANSLTLKVTKIDSQIYLYEALDDNNNGIPNLLSRYEDEGESITKSWPENKKTDPKLSYYTETRAFNYINMNYATTDETEAEIDLKYNINLYPTQSKTLKFSIVNKSEGVNYISFEFADTTYTEQSDINLLKCLSVRVGDVINNTFKEGETPNIESEDVSITMKDKVYFADFIKTVDNKEGIKDMTLDLGDIVVQGSVNKNESKNDDVHDLWFEFTLESYDSITQKFGSDYITESDYQALAGKSLTLPILKATLELRV